MYETFTDRARKVMQLANQEAQRFNHEYVGTEHVLLGLAKESTGVAAHVLKYMGVDLRKIRLEVEKLVQSGPEMVTKGKLPPTPRAKKVIEYSMEEARNLNHNYVGTEHILLGLLREHEGVAAQVLMNLGLKREEVRKKVLNLLGHGLESEGGGREAGSGSAKSCKSTTSTLESFGRCNWQLLPILLLAILLRLWQINESLWLDELHSAWVVAAGPTEIVERAQIGNQSPLYFYLPWATTSLFEMREWALRLPSLVAGVGLVALAYGLAYRFTRSPIAAVASSMLAALDHNFLFYATEARPYACVQLVAAAQLYIFWSLQETSTVSRRVAFVSSSVVLFYLHYTAILLVAGEVVYMLTRRWFRRDKADVPEYTFRKFTIDLLCVAALTLPMIAHLFDIGARRNAWASFVNNTSLLLTENWFSWVSYVVVPAIVWLVVGITKVAITLRRDEPTTRDAVLLATAIGATNAPSTGSSRRSVTATYLLACWLGVPLAIVWLATVTEIAPLYLNRYIIGAALAPVLFAGLCVGFWESRRSQAIVAGLIIAHAVWSSGMIKQFRDDGRLFADRGENWRDAVQYVNDNAIGNSPIFVRSGLLEADRLAKDESRLLRSYCVLPVTSIYRVARPESEIRPLTTRDAGKLTKEDLKQIEASGSAWFIINGAADTRERTAERVLSSWTNDLQNAARSETRGGTVLKELQFGNVGVFLVGFVTIRD